MTAGINASNRLASGGVRWKIGSMRITRGYPRRLVNILLFSGAAAACQPDAEVREPPDLIPDCVYVEVIADLMFLEAGPLEVDSTQDRDLVLDSLRREILLEHGVTPNQVLDFARATGSEAGRMEALWQTITQTYDSMRVASLQREPEAAGEPEGSPAGDGAGVGRAGSRADPDTGSETARRAGDSLPSAGAARRPGLKPGGRGPVRRPADRDTASGPG
jgi:hypothetical protein